MMVENELYYANPDNQKTGAISFTLKALTSFTTIVLLVAIFLYYQVSIVLTIYHESDLWLELSIIHIIIRIISLTMALFNIAFIFNLTEESH